MTHVMVRYRVKPEDAEENERLVRDVFADLATAGLRGLTYATYRLDDGVTFVHLASYDSAASPLPELDAFQRFAAGIRDRCEEQPVVWDMTPVGSYTTSDHSLEA